MRIAKYMTFVLFLFIVLLFIPSQAAAQFYESIEWEILEMVNQERTSRGLPALQMDSNLRNIARGHSKDMGDNNMSDDEMRSHRSSDGTTFSERLDNNNIKRFVEAENLARNSYPQNSTAAVAVNGWMNSTGHKRNITDLHPVDGKILIHPRDGDRLHYNYTGIGVYKKHGQFWFTQVFINADSPPGTILQPPSPAQHGSLQVTIQPAGARSAGAQWRLTSGPDTNWKNSGATIDNLPVGNYTITYRTIAGWTAPSNFTASVTANQTNVITQYYTQVTPPAARWLEIAGDWNGDGKDTIGLYDPRDGYFRRPGYNPYRFGPRNSTWLPIAGDWNGDGKDTLGLYDPINGYFRSPGYDPYRYGPRNSTWLPITGDWNGDGRDTLGLYDPRDGYFRSPGYDPFRFGPRNSTWLPITGDWNGNGKDMMGLYDPRDGNFHLHGLSPIRYGPKH